MLGVHVTILFLQTQSYLLQKAAPRSHMLLYGNTSVWSRPLPVTCYWSGRSLRPTTDNTGNCCCWLAVRTRQYDRTAEDASLWSQDVREMRLELCWKLLSCWLAFSARCCAGWGMVTYSWTQLLALRCDITDLIIKLSPSGQTGASLLWP